LTLNIGAAVFTVDNENSSNKFFSIRRLTLVTKWLGPNDFYAGAEGNF
jgi:hypothetical protein